MILPFSHVDPCDVEFNFVTKLLELNYFENLVPYQNNWFSTSRYCLCISTWIMRIITF